MSALSGVEKTGCAENGMQPALGRSASGLTIGF
jgi:hypothetical protein